VVGMTAAWLVLSERPSAAEIAGGLLLLAGVATAVLRGRNGPAQRRVADRPGAAADPGRGAAVPAVPAPFAAEGALAPALAPEALGADAGEPDDVERDDVEPEDLDPADFCADGLAAGRAAGRAVD